METTRTFVRNGNWWRLHPNSRPRYGCHMSFCNGGLHRHLGKVSKRYNKFRVYLTDKRPKNKKGWRCFHINTPWYGGQRYVSNAPDFPYSAAQTIVDFANKANTSVVWMRYEMLS